MRVTGEGTGVRGIPAPWAALIMALCLAGCATQTVTTSGFLTSYAELSPEPNQPGSRIWIAPGAALDAYQTVLVAPIAFRPDPALGDPELDPEQVGSLIGVYDQALRDAFARRGFALSGQPRARGTAIVRTAITGVRKANPALNVVTTAAAFVPLAGGGLSVETEIVDAASGRPLLRQQFAEAGGILRLAGNFSETGHARAIAADYAERLAERLRPLGARR